MEIQETNGVKWHSNRVNFSPDETHHELRPSVEAAFPYIPKARQQRSGLLIDFLSMRGKNAGKNHVDLIMLGENRFGVLLVNIPSSAGASDDDLLLLKSALRDQKYVESASTTLRALDSFFSENLKAAAGVEAFYAIINQNKRETNFSSAAHAPMLVYRPDEKKIFRLNCEGNALGLAPQAYKDFNGHLRNNIPNLKTETVQIKQHDLLIFYSNGVIEAKNAWGEPFGMNRFLKTIRKNGHKQPTPFLIELQNAIEQFTLGEPIKEDVTVIALKNMLPAMNSNGETPVPDIERRFLTIDEENHLWQTAQKHPNVRINELLDLLGDRYSALGRERIHYYLSTESKQILPTNSQKEIEKPKRRFESVEKFFQRQLLEAFPIRQLLYRKYEFRGNTTVISKALSHYQNGEFQESLMEFSKIRKVIAESESVFCFFGNLYLLLNMSIKARQEYLKAIKVNPKSVHAYLALGYIALMHEDYDSTIHYLSTAVRLDGENIDAYQSFLSNFVAALDKQSGVSEWIV